VLPFSGLRTFGYRSPRGFFSARIAIYRGQSCRASAGAPTCTHAAATGRGNCTHNQRSEWKDRRLLVPLHNSSADQVVIDGRCAPACTMILGIVPADRICVTKNALLGFHAALQPSLSGRRVINGPGTRTLMSFYPIPIRRWIERRGGHSGRSVP
jgi:hypothetical protein